MDTKERALFSLFVTDAARTLLKTEFRNDDLFCHALEGHPQSRANLRFRLVPDEIADDERSFVELHEAGPIGKLLFESVPVRPMEISPGFERSAARGWLPRLVVAQAIWTNRRGRHVSVPARVACLKGEDRSGGVVPKRLVERSYDGQRFPVDIVRPRHFISVHDRLKRVCRRGRACKGSPAHK